MEKIYVQNWSYLFECTYIIKLLKFLPIHAALLRQNIHIQELCTILHIKNFKFDKKRFTLERKKREDNKEERQNKTSIKHLPLMHLVQNHQCHDLVTYPKHFTHKQPSMTENQSLSISKDSDNRQQILFFTLQIHIFSYKIFFKKWFHFYPLSQKS